MLSLSARLPIMCVYARVINVEYMACFIKFVVVVFIQLKIFEQEVTQRPLIAGVSKIVRLVLATKYILQYIIRLVETNQPTCNYHSIKVSPLYKLCILQMTFPCACQVIILDFNLFFLYT